MSNISFMYLPRSFVDEPLGWLHLLWVVSSASVDMDGQFFHGGQALLPVLPGVYTEVELEDTGALYFFVETIPLFFYSSYTIAYQQGCISLFFASLPVPILSY